MAINKELKELIRQIKFHYSIKQGEIAEQLGVTETYLSDAINGRAPFSDSLRSKIYEVFTDAKPKTNQHIVFGGQHVQNGDAINGDKIIQEVADVKDSVEEVVKEDVNIKKVVACEADRLLSLLEAKQRSVDSRIEKQARVLAIMENLSNPK